MGRLYLSRDVNEHLRRVENLSGMSGTAIIDQACDCATPYLAGYNETTALPQKGTVRRSASSVALIVLQEYADATGTKTGQVADYLISQYLPMLVYNKDLRKQPFKGRTIVQVHPMVLTQFHQVKAADPVGDKMKVQDYLWYLTRELPDDIVLRLIDESAATWSSYRCVEGIPYTSMACPRRIYTMVSVASGLYHVTKAGLYSAFLIALLRWYKLLSDSTANLLSFPEPNAGELPWDADALAQLWRYIFDLGLTKKGEQ